MYIFSIKNSLKSFVTILVGCVAVAAVPAQANNSSAAVDIPVTSRSGEGALTGDQRFRQLFASWEALDPHKSARSGAVSEVGPAISIPARMPLEDARMTSSFGMRTHPVLGGRRSHKGIDLAAPIGTPVHATADGIVERADWFSSYGLFVRIDHGGNLETRYAHMSRLAVAAGERVRKGDVIGYVGSTGRSTGPHLHYEVRVEGRAVDPIPYMVETKAQEALALAPGAGGQGGE